MLREVEQIWSKHVGLGRAPRSRFCAQDLPCVHGATSLQPWLTKVPQDPLIRPQPARDEVWLPSDWFNRC